MSVVDTVAVMDHGRIEQVGPPRTIYNAPATSFVARFIGVHNTLPLEIFGMTTTATTPVLYAPGTVTTGVSFLVTMLCLFFISLMRRRRLKHGTDAGVVVGCFDDTGVDAARCVTSAPVIGICQAAMQVASIVSGSFTVVTTQGRSVPAIEHLARRYGYSDLCRKVRASEIPVLALEDPGSGARDQLRAEVCRALDEDGCESIVLGCAGMVDMARSLSEELAVPVVEGVTAAVKIVEGLAALGIATSKRGGYALPRAKTYTGAFLRYAPSGETD